MLAPDVRFEGFTHRDWQRVLELVRPPSATTGERTSGRPSGVVVAVHDGERLLKLLHTEAGRLRLDDLAPDWPVTADELARRHHAARALVLRLGVLDEVMEQLGARLRREHDLTDQLLLLGSLVQQQLRLGGICVWPAPMAELPLPGRALIDRGLDAICPVGKVMLLGLFEDAALWTSLALRRGAAGFDLILGPDEIRGELGLLSGDFRRDHRHLARAVADRTGPLALGCFAERRTFAELRGESTPGAWALAVAVRDVVLYPAPAALALPLGLDAGRAAFSALRQVAARIDGAGLLSPAMAALRDVAASVGERQRGPAAELLASLERWLGWWG